MSTPRLTLPDSYRVLGIDPGSAAVGYGIIESHQKKPVVHAYGVIRPPAKNPPERLVYIEKELSRIIKNSKPSYAAVEELFFAKNKITAMRVSESRGVIFLVLGRLNIPVYEFSPLHVKSIVTGYGRAHKSQIQQLLQSLLNLRQPPRPDDAADALAIALCCIYELNISCSHSAFRS